MKSMTAKVPERPGIAPKMMPMTTPMNIKRNVIGWKDEAII